MLFHRDNSEFRGENNIICRPLGAHSLQFMQYAVGKTTFIEIANSVQSQSGFCQMYLFDNWLKF